MATFTDAFCEQPDIERWLNQALDGDSKPSIAEAATWARIRSSVLQSMCARWGYAVTPATVTAGSRLSDMLTEANAIGAALDYTTAQQLGRTPALSERAARLAAFWTDYVGGPTPGVVTERVGNIEREIKGNLSSLSSDHIISGDTLADPTATTAPYNEPIGVKMGDTY